ncbi:MAG: hypothetical protein ACI8QD_001295 [Cyclobacteriaceae bacterium]|jgi:hypothetical protein
MMKRRKFIAATAAVPIGFAATASSLPQETTNREIYELRKYEITLGGDQKMLIDFLVKVYQPAIKKRGATFLKVFREWGREEPPIIWVLISYRSGSEYIACQQVGSDTDFIKSANSYDSISQDSKIYNRFESSLHLSFEGMPEMNTDLSDSSIFEVRIYEGYSEDAVKRKIKMFNTEEIEVFLKTGINPVFFGETIAGKLRPCLTYMAHFKDMDTRDKNWKAFAEHPDWNTMRIKEEYADTVSKITKIFLTPA